VRRPVERRLAERLREGPLPGEVAAGSRAWPLVAAALAERAPAPRRARLASRLVPALAAIAAALALALTPAGPALGEWIEERFAADPLPTKPAFAGLPEGGTALAISTTGAFAVHHDGSVQRLGAFADAGWSPHGLHVAGVSGRRLVAVDPAGTPKWSITRPGRPVRPAWSLGDGFFVAYLEAGALRVVGGDGRGDKLLRHDATDVTPAWRPGAGYVVSYARENGRVETVDSVSGTRLWERRVGSVVELAWTAGGKRLVALSPDGLTLLDRHGRLVRRMPLPATGRATALALHPSGERAAVLLSGSRQARVLEVGLGGGAARTLFSGLGAVAGLEWSPDGRRLLVAWRDAGQWLLIGPRGRVRALPGVARELGPGAGFPRLAGWCCRRRR
jgi:hypothetical protein